MLALYRTDFTPHDSHGRCELIARTFTGRTYCLLAIAHHPLEGRLYLGVRFV